MGVRDHLTRKDKCFQIISVHNPLAAKIANEFKFDWLSVGGYNVSGSALGLPDVGLLTLSEQAEAVRRIAAIAESPILADGDDGYGNYLNVMRLVREMEKAGGSAIHMEDQVFPKKCGHMEGKRIVPQARFHFEDPRLRRYPQIGRFSAVRPHRRDRGRRLQRSGRSRQRLSGGRRRRDLRRGADHDGAGRAACRN